MLFLFQNDTQILVKTKSRRAIVVKTVVVERRRVHYGFCECPYNTVSSMVGIFSGYNIQGWYFSETQIAKQFTEPTRENLDIISDLLQHLIHKHLFISIYIVYL